MYKECDYLERVEYILDRFKEGEIGNADALIQIKDTLEHYPDEELPKLKECYPNDFANAELYDYDNAELYDYDNAELYDYDNELTDASGNIIENDV